MKLTFNHNRIVIDGRVINLDTLQVKVSRIVLVQHSLGEIRNVLPGVTLASNVNFIALHTERLDESPPKVVKLVGDINLVLNG